MLSLLVSYATAIYLFLLNTLARSSFGRSRTSTSENATELGLGAVNVVEVVEVHTQALGSEKVYVPPSQEADITCHAGQIFACTDEATSAIFRQAFLPSMLAEAMERYGPVKLVGGNESVEEGVNRCSIFSNDDNTSEDHFFGDGESVASSSMTSVGDESELLRDTQRLGDEGAGGRIGRDLTVDEDGCKFVKDSKCLSIRHPTPEAAQFVRVGLRLPYSDESVIDESGDEESFSFSEESDVSEEMKDDAITEVATTDDLRKKSKISSLEEVEGNVGDENNLGNAHCAEVHDPEGDSTPLSCILEKRARCSYMLSNKLGSRCSLGTRGIDASDDTSKSGELLESWRKVQGGLDFLPDVRENISAELSGISQEVGIVFDGAEQKKLIPSWPSLSSLGGGGKDDPVIPRIVVHSSSWDNIRHRLISTPLRPARHDDEVLTEVLDFMQEYDSEIPNELLNSAFEDDETDEDTEDEGEDDSDNDRYDDFSQAEIFMKPGSMAPGSLHLLRVSDDGKYITIEPFGSKDFELRWSHFNSMRKMETIRPSTISPIVDQNPLIEDRPVRSVQMDLVESTPSIGAQTSMEEVVPTHTESKSIHTICTSHSMKDIAAFPGIIGTERVGPIPSIVIQSPSMEDVNIPSTPLISSKIEAVNSVPTVGPSSSIEAIIALLDLPEIESTTAIETTEELIEISTGPSDAELTVVESAVGPSLSIEAIIALLDSPSRATDGVAESTPTIVSPSFSMGAIYNAPARSISTEVETVEPIIPAIIVLSPSMEEIFAMPSHTLEEVGFNIVHSPSLMNLATILTDSEHTEVEEIEFTPSIALEETPNGPAAVEAAGAIQSTPTIVVQSPSMEQIAARPIHPTRGFGEDMREVLDFMNEHDYELPTLGLLYEHEQEDDEDEDSDSMESHDLDTTSTESLTSLEDEGSDDLMRIHDITFSDFSAVGTEYGEDEWKPFFDVINDHFGVPFVRSRAFLDDAVEWFENEPKSSWSEESLSLFSSSLLEEEGGMRDISDYYAEGGDGVVLKDDEPEDKDVIDVAAGEDRSSVKIMGDESAIDGGPTGPILWTLFRPKVAPEVYLQVPGRKYTRS